MKVFTQVRKYGAKIVAGGATLGALSMAHATGPVDTLFAAIDLTTIAASVLGLGLLVVGITMAFKGIDLSKRGVRKV
jgi:hypothetical protein